MVSKGEVKRAANNGQYMEERVSHSDFVAGPDSGNTLPAGEAGEIFQAEVGETSGRLRDLLAAIVGQRPDQQFRTNKGKPQVNFQNGSDADVPDGTQWRVIARKRGRRDGPALTGWREVDDDDPSNSGVDVSTIEPVFPKRPIVREGRIIAIQVKYEGGSFNADAANSTFKLPVQTYDG